MANLTKGNALTRWLRALQFALGEPLDDRGLLTAFLERQDEAAFAELVRRHGPLVWTVCRRLLQSPCDAEDAFQITFLVLARKAASIAQPERLTNWLYGVALRSAKRVKLMRMRQRRADRVRPARLSSVEVESIDSETIEIIHQEVNKLPPRYREAVLLCELQGLQRKEAATRIGIPEGTLSSRLSTARKKLAAGLRRRGVTAGLTALAATSAKAVADAAPVRLINDVARTATMILGGETAGIATHLLQGAEGVIKAMVVAKLKILLVPLLVVIGLSAASAAALWRAAPAPAADMPLPKAVERKETTPGPGFLTGRVIGPDGKPIAGARVWCKAYGAKPIAETRTDGNGRYRLGPFPATVRRREDLLVEAPGLPRQYLEAPAVFPDQDRDLGEITLAQGQRVRGQLLDVDGKPKAGATIEVLLHRYTLGHSMVEIGEPYRVSTDAHGKFESPPLPICGGYLVARMPERVIIQEDLKLRPGKDQEVTLQLRPDKPFVVHVVTENGNPIAGARLAGFWLHDNLVSDAQGRIEIRGLDRAPRVVLRMQVEGYPEQQVTIPNENTQVVLKKPVYLSGRAIDADTGEPVKLSRIVICQLRRTSGGKVEPFG